MIDTPLLNFDTTNYLKQVKEPWVKINLTKDKYEKNKNRETLIDNPKISKILDDCTKWPGDPIKRHNDADHIIHKIVFLADLGLTTKIPQIMEVSNKILQNQSENGLFLSNQLLPKRFGGNDKPSMEWMLCDSPLLTYSLLSFGVKNKLIDESLRELEWLSENNGWRCKSSIKKFRGPGKKEDFCPYANLITLKALSLVPRFLDSEACINGIDSQLMHWENRTGKKIYLFGIGSTFIKLKYPNIWYDILHVIEVLSRYPYAIEQPAFVEMWKIILNKQREDGSFVPESVFRAWKKWSFGQKKHASPWMTYRISEINNRIQQHRR